MSSEEGYWQAIENYAFEIDILSERIMQKDDSPVEKVLNLMARTGDEDYQEILEQTRQLDIICKVIETTYGRTECEVERDVNIVLDRRFKHYANEKLGEKDDETKTGNEEK